MNTPDDTGKGNGCRDTSPAKHALSPLNFMVYFYMIVSSRHSHLQGKMTARRQRKKLFAIMTLPAAILSCTIMLAPANAPAKEEKAAQTRRERTQYHLIKVVQRKLIELGYNPGPINGINGPQTKKAIMEFQRDQGIAVDGIPGPQTLKSLGL